MQKNEQLSTKACKACRSQHKKCDRKIPCTRCSKNGRECHYEDIVKRGPKSNAMHAQPYPLASNIRRSPEFVPPQSLLNFANCIQPGDKLFAAIEYVQNDFLGKENTLVPDEDEWAVIYSMKASMLKHFKANNSEKAEIMFRKARIRVMAKFDQLHNNILLLACTIFLGIYCVMANDYERSIFFLDNARAFFERNTQSDPTLDLLRLLFEDVEQMVSANPDLEREVKRNIVQMDYMQKVRITMFSIGDEPITFEDFEKVESDVRNNTDLFELVPERIKRIQEQMLVVHNKVAHSVSREAIDMIQYMGNLNMQGAVAQRYFRLGDIKKAVQLADYIAFSTVSPYFATTFLSMGQVITLAANIHLYCYCMFTDTLTRSNALTCLKLELDALSLIRTNKIIGPALEGIIDKISYMLRSAQEQQIITQLTKQIDAYEFEDEIILSVGPDLAIEDGTSNSSNEYDVLDQFFEEFM